MNGALEERREAEKRIKEYVQASAQGLNKKEEDDFRKLVIQNEEAAKKVFRSMEHTGKTYILIYLNEEYFDLKKDDWVASKSVLKRYGIDYAAIKKYKASSGKVFCCYDENRNAFLLVPQPKGRCRCLRSTAAMQSIAF